MKFGHQMLILFGITIFLIVMIFSDHVNSTQVQKNAASIVAVILIGTFLLAMAFIPGPIQRWIDSEKKEEKK